MSRLISGESHSGHTSRIALGLKTVQILPAVETFTKQSNANVQIRSASKFHDRYVLVDNQVCYQSDASFKDGAKSAPTTLTQITDAFVAVTQTYEALWKSAKVER